MGRGFGIAASIDHAVMKQVAKAAEDAGFSSFWVNDTPGNDGLDGLAAAASVTSQIKLGVGVIPLDRRPSGSIADDVQRLQLPQDRLWLGIGSPARQGGLDKVRSGAAELHERLRCKVIVAALGPKMSGVAGEVGDGVLFNWLLPAYVAGSVERVEFSARQHDRPRPLMMAYIRSAIMPEAEERLNQEAGRYAGIPNYAAHFERQGVEAAHTAVRGVNSAALQSRIEPYEGLLDETVVRAITVDDSAGKILELLAATAPHNAG
ncbi:MAG: LLM class flavin-dependent oxidoreductase [Chloroflexia bacterium]|nr:LLM class flavin-dependent oxidoreductase [Chloroflexia bacterium]